MVTLLFEEGGELCTETDINKLLLSYAEKAVDFPIINTESQQSGLSGCHAGKSPVGL